MYDRVPQAKAWRLAGAEHADEARAAALREARQRRHTRITEAT
jgi:hypothetical protein